MKRKNKLIRLTRFKDGRSIRINISHIIDVEARTEWTFRCWKEKRKTWFGLGPDKEVDRSAYDKLVEIEGSVVTTTQYNGSRKRYTRHSSYWVGGSNVSVEVKESPEDIAKMINEVEK